MKSIVFGILILILSAPLFAEYPPEGWTDSITEAIALAEQEEKWLLLDFTGSDWCAWCVKLEQEVWSTPEFQVWAEENVVRVFLDFPRQLEQSEDVRQQNFLLQQMLGVQGYPTVWLMNSDLAPLLRTGYRAGGPEEYIRHLEEDQISLDPERVKAFQDGFRSGVVEYLGPIG